MMNYDDFEDLEGSELGFQAREALERSKQEFVKGCYEAYDVLVHKGKDVLKETDVSEIQKALNRMTQLFIMKEDYERCSFLRKYAEENIPGFVITPDPSVIKELSL